MLKCTKEEAERALGFLNPEQLGTLYNALREAETAITAARDAMLMPESVEQAGLVPEEKYAYGIETLYAALGSHSTDFEELRELVFAEGCSNAGQAEFEATIRRG